MKPLIRKYVYEGRNGYYAVDEYKGNVCQRTVESGMTRKAAVSLAGNMNMAVSLFMRDNGISDEDPESCAQAAPSLGLVV